MPLFKYMSAEVAPLFAGTLRVRFTQPSDLNDPFEFRPLIDFEGTAEEFRKVVDARISAMFGSVDGALTLMERQQAADPNYPAIIPIQVFRKMIADNPALGQQFMLELQRHKLDILGRNTKAAVWEAQWDKLHQTFGQSVGIFSLTEDSVHTLMWSHYASQHFGVVVAFDERSPWFSQQVTPSDDLRHLVRVTYVQNPQPRTWGQLQGADVLYTKNAEWSYEREWRIIRPLKDGIEISPGRFCFDVPPDAVRAIIFGCRTTSTLELTIRNSVEKNSALGHVCFRQARAASGGKIELHDA